ncbi:MAG: hypothetical protein AVDCRST_MAG75-35 [uncultured Propionibacteriaceae bacterium]|uniref:Uncharacterized protein n=1 Tax=uncultured Propionibacteriaceae bacterium TaxID=257457 RepID=A0A6J4MW71_9ACTN|nr:MAG: hypothetical protein AVDCRST_MAG75-35 [uncultured Propionibacteriaceae bacterium]
MTEIAVWANIKLRHRICGAFCCVQTNTTRYQSASDLSNSENATTPEWANCESVHRCFRHRGAARRVELGGGLVLYSPNAASGAPVIGLLAPH